MATLHKRSDRHKKNFALLVSGGFTLSIFGIWFLVTYGEPAKPAVAQADGATVLTTVPEVSPLQSLGDSLASSWEALLESVKGISKAVPAPNLNQGYQEMKSETLNTYGR